MRDKIKEQFADLGEQALKNIARPMRAYQVVSDRTLRKTEPTPPGTAGSPDVTTQLRHLAFYRCLGGHRSLYLAFHCELRNGSVSVTTFNADDVLNLQAQAVNNSSGAVILFQPSGVTAFASSNSPNAHALSWAVRLGTGSWTIRIMTQLLDRAPAGTVSALIGNWTMEVTRYN